jgi:hypothetical protein
MRNFSAWMPTFYAWVPAVVVATVVILVLPWLAVIALLALLVLATAFLFSLVWAFVAAAKALFRPAFATVAPMSSTPGSFQAVADQSVRFEKAGFNPIDAYEHPWPSASWTEPGDDLES